MVLVPEERVKQVHRPYGGSPADGELSRSRSDDLTLLLGCHAVGGELGLSLAATLALLWLWGVLERFPATASCLM